MMQPFLANTEFVSLTILFCAFVLMNTLIDCQYLMIHLCYYIIAYYIQVLHTQLGDVIEKHTISEKVRNSLVSLFPSTNTV